MLILRPRLVSFWLCPRALLNIIQRIMGDSAEQLPAGLDSPRLHFHAAPTPQILRSPGSLRMTAGEGIPILPLPIAMIREGDS